MVLVSDEYDLLCKIARKTGMDCWFSIVCKNGKDYVRDLEEQKTISLRTGVKDLIEGMTDEDVCTIFQSLVLNGLNLAAKVPVKEAYVCLQVMHIDNGYEIRCRNTCVGIEKIQKSSKQKQESIIFGMELVDRLIRKYHGTVEKNSVRQKEENICRAEMLIRIPYNQN